MGRTTAGSLPAIRKHQGVGQYYVRLVRDGVAQTYYLGRLSDGLEAAQRRYEDLIENYLKRKKKIPAAGTATVARVIGDFLDYAENRYQKHGRSTGTYERFKRVLRPFLERYGEVKIADFGLDQLAEYRNELLSHRIRRGGKSVPLSRTTVNERIAQIKSVFARARQWGLVPKEVLWDLRDLQPLRNYESVARETAPVISAPAADVEKVIAELARTNPVVADMVRVHYLTGCRSSELCMMRPCDFRRDFDDGIWEYEPAESKTEHHGKVRVIPIGPKAQAVLIHYFDECDPEEFLFSPRKAVALANRLRAEKATTHKRYVRATKRATEPGSRYSHETYRRCVQRAAERVGVKITPHQLRHSAATEIDQKIGKEAAQTVLGHASLKTTDIYADYNRPLAHRAALERG